MRLSFPVITLAVLLTATAAFGRQRDEPFDVLFTGGKVLDGTGNPWFYADVGVRDGRIVAVGSLKGHRAHRLIDASGRVVVPGFIDLHSHADDAIFGADGLRSDDPHRRAGPNLVTQGITTVVVNQDGRSTIEGIAAQKAELIEKTFGPNAILMVGHNTVRRQAMGADFRRPATPAEVDTMRALVRRGMEAGAFGLTAGLEYVPGRWSTTDEVVALVEEIVPYGGIYISHERSEADAPMWWRPSRDDPGAPTLLDAVQETIAIGERTGATVVATHLKARGTKFWGASRAVISLVERARQRGVAVFGDQYPYDTSGSDGGTVLIPGWAFAAPRHDEERERDRPRDFATYLEQTLEDEAHAVSVRQDVAHEIAFRGGADNIVVFDYPDSTYVGQSLAALAAARDVTPVEMAFILQTEGYRDRPGGARLRSFSMNEQDIEAFAAQHWVATTTDGAITLPEEGPDVHARYYGTFPRKIRRYAIERGVLSVADAVRSATSLPAEILGLRNRGQVREGFWADLAVLDLDALRDEATFFEPHQYSSGVEYVMVNGAFVLAQGRPTWALPGKVITPDDGRSGPTSSNR